MKQYLIVITCFLLLIGCKPNDNGEDKSEIIRNGKEAIENNEGNEMEKRLLTQLEEFLIAYSGDDPEKAISYCYPDIFKWMSQQSSGKYTVDKVKNEIANNIRSMDDGMKNENISISFEIGEMTNKVNLKFDKVYTIIYHEFRKKGLDEVKIRGEIVAVSIDNGESWKFLSDHIKSVQAILRMRYSQEVVSQILNL